MKLTALTVALAAFALPAAATVVDFEGAGTAFHENGYSFGGFTFFGTNGGVPRTFEGSADGRTTYILSCVAGVGCATPALRVVFDAPTDTFSLNVVADEETSTTLVASFVNGGGTTVLTADGFDGDGDTKDFVSWSGLAGATEVTLSSNDRAGVGYDDLSTDAGAPVVPLPAGLPLALSGFAALGILRQRKG